MSVRPACLRLFSAALGLMAVLTVPVMGQGDTSWVNLEWRPLQQSIEVGEIVELDLFAVSVTGGDVPIAGMDLALTWDAGRLELLGRFNPCPTQPCAPGTYNWLQSNFPVDAQLDRLNADCGSDLFCNEIPCDQGCPTGVTCNDQTGFCRSTGLPTNDGDAFFQVQSRFGVDAQAVVTPDGLWVTTLLFRALKTGAAEVRMEPGLGGFTLTRVLDGLVPGVDVTNELSAPADILIEPSVLVCESPEVAAIGSRYLSITPAPATQPVALWVEGAEQDPAVRCVAGYVQVDGTLGASPVFQPSETWGAVFVTGEAIRPLSGYRVETNCDLQKEGLRSDPVTVTTWRWGDTSGDGVVDLSDWVRVIDASEGRYSGNTIPENVDLAPCTPDGVIDNQDIDAAQGAFFGQAFPCPAICTPFPEIEDWAQFTACMVGPAGSLVEGCNLFDFDATQTVDLRDAAAFQNELN